MSTAKKSSSKSPKKKNAQESRPQPARKAKPNEGLYVVCIGASAGGLNAVTELLSRLPESLPAAFFIVLHLAKSSVGDIFVARLRGHTKLACLVATHDETIKPGRVYVAPAGGHLLLRNGKIAIGKGPPENRFRPSIDVLFRSAAASYTERAIGIVMTGFLNDGVAGMWAIAQCGGHSIVQDPNEAETPDMPLAVLDSMDVDHCIPIRDMPDVISRIVQTYKIKGVKPPAKIVAEAELSARAATGIETAESIGEKTVYACPECGGGLWNVKNGRLNHFRCHIGHSYSEADLSKSQLQQIEATLWVAVRMMEERKNLLQKMARQHTNKGLDRLSETSRMDAIALDAHISTMKELLFAGHKD